MAPGMHSEQGMSRQDVPAGAEDAGLRWGHLPGAWGIRAGPGQAVAGSGQTFPRNGPWGWESRERGPLGLTA